MNLSQEDIQELKEYFELLLEIESINLKYNEDRFRESE
jgi:hypothetical protein